MDNKNSTIQTPFTKKRIIDLLPGDIVLHPVYRCDGLLLVNRFKTISSSLIMHIRKHLPESYPVLTVASLEELGNLIDSQYLNSPQFSSELEEINKQYYSLCNLSMKLQDISFKQSNPVESIDAIADIDSNAVVDCDKKEDLINQIVIHSKTFELFTNPLWGNIEVIFDSQILRERAKEVQNLITEAFSENPMLYLIVSRLRKYHDALWIHSVNSTCISLIIGLSLELSIVELVDLGLASLFADIGFLEMPKEEFILYLNQRKNEIYMVNEHIKKSIEIASRVPFLRKKSILHGIYEHHEKMDGSGHPLGKKGKEINVFGRIIKLYKLNQ